MIQILPDERRQDPDPQEYECVQRTIERLHEPIVSHKQGPGTEKGPEALHLKRIIHVTILFSYIHPAYGRCITALCIHLIRVMKSKTGSWVAAWMSAA